MCAASFGNKLNFLITLLQHGSTKLQKRLLPLWNLFLNNLTFDALLFSKSEISSPRTFLDRETEKNIDLQSSWCKNYKLKRIDIVFLTERRTKFKTFSTNIENFDESFVFQKEITLIFDRVHVLFRFAIVFDE